MPRKLEQIIARALERNISARYPSASELLADLSACKAATSVQPARKASVLTALRKPAVMIALIVALVAVGIPGVAAYRRNANIRRARNDAIPQIRQLIAADNFAAAFTLATDVERILPGDPVLADLWPQFSARGSSQHLRSRPSDRESRVERRLRGLPPPVCVWQDGAQ